MHDTLEDCPHISFKDIENNFGLDVANIVFSLTKLPNGKPNYKALKADNFGIGTAVKLADTISNLYQGIEEINPKGIKYINRMTEFKSALYIQNQNEVLWRLLEHTIINYKIGVLDTLTN